jgi:hypothetical protein
MRGICQPATIPPAGVQAFGGRISFIVAQLQAEKCLTRSAYFGDA